MIEYLEQTIRDFEGQIEVVLAPFRAAVACLVTIPGISAAAANVIIAEIGVDMNRFATVAHLRSWAGLCPQLNESAGKIRSRRLRHGAPWLKTVLVQCAWAATRNKHNYLHAQFVRLRARRGPQKAIIAVAASILSIAYYLLRNQVPYAISEHSIPPALIRSKLQIAWPAGSKSSAMKSEFAKPPSA